MKILGTTLDSETQSKEASPGDAADDSGGDNVLNLGINSNGDKGNNGDKGEKGDNGDNGDKGAGSNMRATKNIDPEKATIAAKAAAAASARRMNDSVDNSQRNNEGRKKSGNDPLPNDIIAMNDPFREQLLSGDGSVGGNGAQSAASSSSSSGLNMIYDQKNSLDGNVSSSVSNNVNNTSNDDETDNINSDVKDDINNDATKNNGNDTTDKNAFVGYAVEATMADGDTVLVNAEAYHVQVSEEDEKVRNN
jgi:hypothetical protein